MWLPYFAIVAYHSKHRLAQVDDVKVFTGRSANDKGRNSALIKVFKIGFKKSTPEHSIGLFLVITHWGCFLMSRLSCLSKVTLQDYLKIKCESEPGKLSSMVKTLMFKPSMICCDLLHML